MGTKLLQLSNKLTSASGGTETFWTTVTVEVKKGKLLLYWELIQTHTKTSQV